MKKIKGRAGMFIFYEDGTRELVGDVNELMGVCDDCRDHRVSDIVAHTEPLVAPEFEES